MRYRKQSRTPGRHNEPQPLHCLKGALCNVTREEKPVVQPFLLRLTQPYFTLHETPQHYTLPNTFARILLLVEGGLCCHRKHHHWRQATSSKKRTTEGLEKRRGSQSAEACEASQMTSVFDAQRSLYADLHCPSLSVASPHR